MPHDNGCCSFCRKSHRDVGPLVEGPDRVYICGDCVELCQSIIQQERRRRDRPAESSPAPTAEDIRAKLDQLVGNQEEAKTALALAAHLHAERLHQRGGASPSEKSHVLLLGPPSGSALLARALAHALEVPFASGDASALVEARGGTEQIEPILSRLLSAGDFDAEMAQRGIVYVNGVDQRPTQEALLRLWAGAQSDAIRRFQVDVGRILFVCGGAFAGFDEACASAGRHPEQPVTGDTLSAFGMMPELVRRLFAIARVAPLNEETLARIVPRVDFDRMAREGDHARARRS